VAERSDNSIRKNSNNSLPLTGAGVVIDIGTGDGHFVSHCARQNPHKFYIGIDANPRPLEKLSEKIHRKPAKGGLPNVLFVQASVEDLPAELDGVADEVHIHFPWGSLLRAVALGDESALRNLRRVCAPEAWLEIVMGLDPTRDRSEIERLGLPPLTDEYLKTILAARYQTAGFTMVEAGALSGSAWGQLKTSWAQRLKGNAERSVVYLIARARSS
jgi:16S rRNA (adenine(1408)-N(1))-methyltransferase